MRPPVIIMADPEIGGGRGGLGTRPRGAAHRTIPGPVPNRHGGTRSPASADLDPVWSRIQEAGVPVGFHGTDKVLDRYITEWEEPNKRVPAMFSSTFNMAVSHGRPIFDTMAALVCHGLFARFPDLRIATIETG